MNLLHQKILQLVKYIPFDIALQEIMQSCIEEKLPHLDTAMRILINFHETIFNEAKITS